MILYLLMLKINQKIRVVKNNQKRCFYIFLICFAFFHYNIIISDKEIKLRNQDLAKSVRIKRGTDNIGNWALAHSWCNCLHGSKNIKNENFPFSKEAGIKYFKTLVQDVNNGLLSAESVIAMAKNYFEQTGIRIKLKGMKYTRE